MQSFSKESKTEGNEKFIFTVVKCLQTNWRLPNKLLTTTATEQQPKTDAGVRNQLWDPHVFQGFP